jgi:DNA-binding PadR family transcriptional regulator
MVGPARKKKRRWSITERDLAALAHLARYGAATAEQIRREFFGDSLQSAYRRLRALEDRGVVKGERIFYRMPQIYRITEAGARLSETDLAPPRHDLSRLPHTLEVAELSWKVRSEEAAVEMWRTEREIRREKLMARREKVSGRMLKKGKMGRIPDGVIVLQSGHEVAVELELTPKRAANYHRIFTDYEAHLEEGDYDEVRFYFASETAMRRVEELSEKHDLLDGYLEFRHYQPVFEHRK